MSSKRFCFFLFALTAEFAFANSDTIAILNLGYNAIANKDSIAHFILIY